jgi:hypothetical protein
MLAAAVPGYLKDNSHGEFVFDHAWANAYARHGLDYFPKWLGAVPYSPVTGPRLLAGDNTRRRQLLQAIAGHVRWRPGCPRPLSISIPAPRMHLFDAGVAAARGRAVPVAGLAGWQFR